MLSYLIRRVLLGLLTLWLVTFIVYALSRSMPGSPLDATASESPDKKMSERDRQLRMEAYGLNKGIVEGYIYWMEKIVLHGDLGFARSEGMSVSKAIRLRMGPTLLLSGTSLLLTYLLSVPIGLYSTVRNSKIDERATSMVLYMLYSLPTYVAALQLLFVFYVGLRGTVWQMKPGMVSDNYADLSLLGKCFDIGWHMILPLFCFTYGSFAYYSRFVKANLEEAIRQDYIRTARAKGIGPWNVLFFHAFRNTLIPFVTMIGLSLPALLGGSIIIEQVFSWPGMGQLFTKALGARDYNVIMGLTLMFSILTLLGQLLADFMYALVDPRVSLE